MEAFMRKILVSACLYGGEPVRYDGKPCPCTSPVFLRWKEEGRLVPVCPETAGGMGVPRLPSEITGDRVLSSSGEDVTEYFARGAAAALGLARENCAAFAVLKEGSPSCGSGRIHDGSFSGACVKGQGMAAQALAEAGFRVFSEEGLDEAAEFLCSRPGL